MQDIHFTDDIVPSVQTQCGYKCLFNSLTSNARGVPIMLNNNFQYQLHKIKSDNTGYCIALDITIEGERITILKHLWTKY